MPGYTDRNLTPDEISAVVKQAFAEQPTEDERVLVIVPDGTRTAPIPVMFRAIHRELHARVGALDFLVALGTHQPMSPERLNQLLGVAPEEEATYGDVRIFNHEWWREDAFVSLGEIPAHEVAEISGGMLSESVPIRINRKVLEYDRVVVCGPVFPHEVVGFSGGNKYFFPGVAGPEIIDLSHWLGALITNHEIIGIGGTTPVRALIDRAAAAIPTPKMCLAMVVAPGNEELAGLYSGSPEAAWSEAARLSSRLHVRYVERPFERVLSVMPESYEDMWTAAKGMYKLEPVVADGGEVVVYAPHITEFSTSHGDKLAEVGYHVRDYFTKQWDRFGHYPGTILAHSTHLKGAGDYDEANGERPRIRVTLATGISPERCAAHNLEYLDPDAIDPEDWRDREEEGLLLVPRAGEMLYRLIS